MPQKPYSGPTIKATSPEPGWKTALSGLKDAIAEQPLVKMMTTPLTTIPSKVGTWLEDKITTPTLPSPGVPENVSKAYAMGKGFLGGAAKGAGDVVTGLTTPAALVGLVGGLRAPAPKTAANLAHQAEIMAEKGMTPIPPPYSADIRNVLPEDFWPLSARETASRLPRQLAPVPTK